MKKSRYSFICVRCGVMIKAGDEITRYTTNGVYVHKTCNVEIIHSIEVCCCVS